MAETTISSRSTSDLANVVLGQPIADSLLFALDENADGRDELAYPINYGSSFVMALQYTEDGPQAEMFLSYSQDHDPEGEHFKDQTLLYSDLEWRPMLFTEEDIAAAVVNTVELRE